MRHHLLLRPVRVTLFLLALGAAACSSGLGEGALPTLEPTATAAPHATPTAVAVPEIAPAAVVNWDDIAPFRQAMRPGYEDDVTAFADANRYSIEVTLELGDTAVLYGSQRVRHTNRSHDTYDQLIFRLHPNLLDYSGARMTVTNVRVNDAPVVTQLVDRNYLLEVPLAEPLPPGQSVEVVMDFTSVVEGGFPTGFSSYFLEEGVFSAPEWYPLLSVYEEGRGWWRTRQNGLQGETAYGETALFEVRMTADEDVTIILSGDEIETIDNGDGTLTHHVVSGPMRDSVVFASRRFLETSTEYDGININFYYWDFFPPDEDSAPGRSAAAAEAGLQMAANAFEVYNRVFGQYPFNELDVVQTATGAGGIEYPGVIVVADNVWNVGAPFYEVVIAHEVAHQWWYSLVGNDQTRWPFLDEALAGFTEYVYGWELAQSEADMRAVEDQVRQDQLTYNAFLSQGNRDVPIGLSNDSFNPTTSEWAIGLYAKAPLFYYEITQLIGREQTYAALAEYFRRFEYKNAEPADLLAAFEDTTGMDWDEFFYRWVGDFPGLEPAAIATVDAQRALEGGG